MGHFLNLFDVKRSSQADPLVLPAVPEPFPPRRRLVLFVYRDCNSPFNPFHCMDSLVNSFEVLLTLGIPFRHPDVHVHFTDRQAAGPFRWMWKAMVLDDQIRLKREWADPSEGQLAQGQLYEHAIVQRFDSSRMWWAHWKKIECPFQSPFLAAFSFRMRQWAFEAYRTYPDEIKDAKAQGLLRQIQEQASAQQPGPAVDIITVVLRKGTSRAVISNEAELIATLEARFPEAKVVPVDLAGRSWLEQTTFIVGTRVFVAMFGAGMTWEFLLPPGAGVVEMAEGQRGLPDCYLSIGARLGLVYRRWVANKGASWMAPRTKVDAIAIADLVEEVRSVQREREQRLAR